MDNRLKDTIKKIVQLSQQDPEFATELRKALKIVSSTHSVYAQNVPANVQAIRAALEIRANHSINYDFIKEERLKKQFYIDNLRMENAALDLKKDETERFYIFCINAFYQVENIINYYYYKTYPSITNLINAITEATRNDGDGKYSYKNTGREKTVGDIPIASKLNAFCNTFFPNDPIKMTYVSLRQVRNEGEHRWMTMIREENEESPLYKFYKYQSFNSVRILLIKLVNEVKKQLEEQQRKGTIPYINYEFTVEGIIHNKLPSACFISINGSNELVPSNLFSKVSNLTIGEKVNVTFHNKKIINIEPYQ